VKTAKKVATLATGVGGRPVMSARMVKRRSVVKSGCPEIGTRSSRAATRAKSQPVRNRAWSN
jgi:hypothetical protein